MQCPAAHACVHSFPWLWRNSKSWHVLPPWFQAACISRAYGSGKGASLTCHDQGPLVSLSEHHHSTRPCRVHRLSYSRLATLGDSDAFMVDTVFSESSQELPPEQGFNEACIDLAKKESEQGSSWSLDQVSRWIDLLYSANHPKAFGLCMSLYRQMLQRKWQVSDELYQKLMMCQVQSGSVASVFNMVRFAMQYYPSVPFWASKPSPYYDLVTNAYIHGTRMGPSVLAKAFVRLSQNSDIQLRLSDCITHFRHEGMELHLDAYNAALFQLFKSASESTFEFFLAMKEWGQLNVTSYKLLVSHLCNEGRATEATLYVQEACQQYGYSVALVADVFKSYLANRQVGEAMAFYQRLLHAWPSDIHCSDIERVILMFLTFSELPLARIRGFLDLVLDARGFPWHIENYVFLMSLYLGHELGPALRVLHALASKERHGPWLAELHSCIIKTYLCAKPRVRGQVLCNAYIEKFKIGHATISDGPEQSPLVSLFQSLDPRLAILLSFAARHAIRLTPLTHFRMLQKLSTLTRYDKICEYYSLLRAEMERVIHKKSVGLLFFALMHEHEWSHLLHLLTVCSTTRTALPTPYKPIRELPDVMDRYPFLRHFPSNAAPVSHLLAYARATDDLTEDQCHRLLALLSERRILAVRDLRLQLETRPEQFDTMDSMLFMSLQRIVRFPRELKSIHDRVIKLLSHVELKD